MTRRIRVAHVIESLARGGAERLLVTTLAHLDRSRFDNHVFPLFDRLDLAPEITALGVPVTCVHLRSFYDVTSGLGRLRRLLRDFQPDIVHTVLQRADIYGRVAAATARLGPIISTLHECPYNPEVFIDNPDLSRFRYGLFKQVDKATARTCNDAFIVVSRATQGNLERYFGVRGGHVRVLYSGIDLADVDRNDGRHERFRAELGIQAGELVLLNVARLFQQKGQRYLIQAMQQVVQRVPKARLLIRGDGPDLGELQALTKALGLQDHVTFLDSYRAHADILGLIRMCDVFVYPSLYEGLGIALIEALAVGRPCVSSNVGQIPEVIDEGRTGLLVPSMNPEALANALISLLGDPERRQRMGKEGRAVVEERFDIRRTVKQLEQGYVDLLAGRWGKAGQLHVTGVQPTGVQEKV